MYSTIRGKACTRAVIQPKFTEWKIYVCRFYGLNYFLYVVNVVYAV